MDTTQINRELIISSDVSEVNIVLLEDKQLVEFHKEQKNSNVSVGDVYLGRIKKILPGLNAAFVDIGNKKDAFLHYLDLGPQILSLNKYTKLAREGKSAQLNMDSFELEKSIDKTGKISDFVYWREKRFFRQTIWAFLFGFYSLFMLSWITVYSVFTVRDSRWLSREIKSGKKQIPNR